MWPGMISFSLNSVLPSNFRCGPKVHLASLAESDVALFVRYDEPPLAGPSTSGGTDWETVAPTILLETDELTPAEYEVRVYDTTTGSKLVAVVELVSPCNKDRPQSRTAFVDKCHALLQQGVCVAIVDPVTNLSANLYAELADRLGAKPPAIADSSIYAVSCRTHPRGKRIRVEAWQHRLDIGSPLPTLPLWLTESFAVDLELEKTYEDTCRGLRIP